MYILVGMSVLEVVMNEKLMSSAKMVGKYLTAELTKLKERYFLKICYVPTFPSKTKSRICLIVCILFRYIYKF